MIYEKDIETKVCKYAKSKSILALKFESSSAAGIPDRIFITKEGKIFFIEFKHKIGTLSELQKYYINLLRKRNIDVYIVNKYSNGKRVIQIYA